MIFAVSQANANTAGVIGVALAFIVAGTGVWRYAVRRGRKIEKAAIEQAALKQLVDANLLTVVGALADKVGQLSDGVRSVQTGLREVKQSVADMRKASKPNGKNTDEIGDQVALLRDDVAAVADKVDAHLRQIDGESNEQK